MRDSESFAYLSMDQASRSCKGSGNEGMAVEVLRRNKQLW